MKKIILLLTILLLFTSCQVKYTEIESSVPTVETKEITYTTETTTETTTVEVETTEKTTAKAPESSTQRATETKLETEPTSDTATTKKGSAAFYFDDNEPVYISAEEYYQICGVVMNETGYGSYEGCVAVAQCIRTQIIREKHKGNPYDIASIRNLYGEYYTKTPNDLVRRAVTDVFYNHIVVTTEPIIAWCNGGSSWHNQQIKVCSYDGNEFYKLRVKDW